MRIMQQFFYIVTSKWEFFNMFLYKTYKHKAHAAAGASGKSEGKKNRSCERCFHLGMVGCGAAFGAAVGAVCGGVGICG